MDLTSLIIAVPLVLLMLYLLVRLPLAIVGNLRAGHRFRESLAASLDQLRLSRMLGHLGINRQEYLHTQSGLTIQNHMTRCDGCDEKARCDQVLDSETKADTESLGFCANIDDLKALPRQ